LAFYDKYIHPSSSERSVLSVHVKSQIGHQTPDPIEQLAEDVKLFIANEGYDIPPDEVTEAVNGDLNLLPQKLLQLIVARGYDADRAARSVAKGAEILNAQIQANGDAKTNGVIENHDVKVIRVDDLEKYRNTLALDDEPVPVQPLETFYQCESPRL